MKDRLEDFVRGNAEAFDTFEPSDAVWSKLEKELDKKKPIRWSFVASRVAAVAAIFIISFVVQRVFIIGDKPTLAHHQEVKIDIPELNEAELYYSSIINAKLSEVKPLLNEHPVLERELNHDLTELDSIYASLKNDLKDDIANHEVLEAMIQNYRLRIEILEQMLGYLEDDKNDDTNNKGYDL